VNRETIIVANLYFLKCFHYWLDQLSVYLWTNFLFHGHCVAGWMDGWAFDGGLFLDRWWLVASPCNAMLKGVVHTDIGLVDGRGPDHASARGPGGIYAWRLGAESGQTDILLFCML
jgi:hypothetical protein